METDFVKLMTTKSDEGLQEYIDNRQKFAPLAIYAAIDELKKRGRTFSDEEFTQIVNDIEKQQEISRQRVAESDGGNKWDKNVVDDINAPQFYSEKAIWLFSVLFSVFFGSILLAINVNKTEKKNSSWTVAGFGLLYTVLQMWGLSYMPNNTALTFAVSACGAYILNSWGWKSFIGKETKYRKKPIWIPLIIALIIFIPLLYLIIVFGQE